MLKNLRSFLTNLLSSFLIIVCMMHSTAQADQVRYLLKGETAPYTGFLFDEEKANNIKNAVVERDGYKLINESLERSIQLHKANQELYIQQRDIFRTQNDKLAIELEKERSTSTLSHILWFSLGVLATGIAVYGAKQITK